MKYIKKYNFNSYNVHRMRCWERINLPHYGKEVGYFLFLELAKFEQMNNQTLKVFYLSMPYAESTVRLILRNLENDGWIRVQTIKKDKRIRNFDLTDKFRKKRSEWLHAVEEIFLDC